MKCNLSISNPTSVAKKHNINDTPTKDVSEPGKLVKSPPLDTHKVTKEVSYAAKAKRAKPNPTPAPYKLYVHSVTVSYTHLTLPTKA